MSRLQQFEVGAGRAASGRYPVSRGLRWLRGGATAVLALAERIAGGGRRRARALGVADRAAALSWARWPVGEATRRAVVRARGDSATIRLGRIDNDGRLTSELGGFPGLSSVGGTEFVERYRYSLDLLLEGDSVFLRKDFRGDRAGFLREWQALATLGGIRAPALLRVDETALVLDKSFVPGPTLRDLLVAAGARILSVDTERDPDLLAFEPAARIEVVWARGRQRLAAVGGQALVSEIEQAIRAVHAHGVTGMSFTFGNVVIEAESGLPWLIDFDNAQVDRRRGRRFRRRRQSDDQLFSRIYLGR